MAFTSGIDLGGEFEYYKLNVEMIDVGQNVFTNTTGQNEPACALH